MNQKTQPFFRLLLRNLSTRKLKPKFDFTSDAEVEESLKAGSLKAHKHPGVFGISTVSLPDNLTKAAEILLKDYPKKSLEKDAQNLSNYIWSRHAPLEPQEYRIKQKEMMDMIKETECVDLMSPNISEEEKKRLSDSLQSKLHHRMKKEIYHWKPIEYEQYKSAVYLVARLAPDYAALVRILAEVRKRDPGFTPLTMLDFGSGVGSGIWALEKIWPDMCREAVCVDSSADMNNIAYKLLCGGELDGSPIGRTGGTYFRQFLPMSSLLKYDVVLSSRSLLELPDMTSRLKTLDILWRKTNTYLVIVEPGTNAGYKIVQEARDYVLELSRQAQEEGQVNPEGFVFAPCPHDKLCPKFFDGSNIPCNFEVTYYPLSFEKVKAAKKDKFTYVVMKRGRRKQTTEKQWPRLVETPLLRKKHITCRTCTHFGTLRELTATKSKHSRECYRLIKKSNWGDMLPVNLPELHTYNGNDVESTGDCLNEPQKCDQN